MSQTVNTVVIGGGQAGLVTGYHLKKQGVEHVILDENGEVGAAWRRRWDSLELFTPSRYSGLPGMPFPGDPRAFPGKDDVADYLEVYAGHFDLPVMSGVHVERVTKDDYRYAVEAGEGRIMANNVVVATGAFHNPRVPEFSRSLDSRIVQMHSSEYQRPSQVQPGPVLVVGAGQSGAEIALDLAGDHKVWISGRDAGEEPVTRGSWTERLMTPFIVFAFTKVVNVANPIGRKARARFLYPPRGIPRAGGSRKRLLAAGVEWLGRTTGAKDGYPQLEDGTVLEVANVIWCSGFVTDYHWIDLPVFDEYGYPIHNRGVVESHPGLYFMGLLFQRTLSSALIMGMGKDAEYVATHIKKHRMDESRQEAHT